MHSQSFSSMASLGPEKNVFFDYRYAYVMKCLKSRTIFTFSWLVLNVLTLCSHESGHFSLDHWSNCSKVTNAKYFANVER